MHDGTNHSTGATCATILSTQCAGDVEFNCRGSLCTHTAHTPAKRQTKMSLFVLRAVPCGPMVKYGEMLFEKLGPVPPSHVQSALGTCSLWPHGMGAWAKHCLIIGSFVCLQVANNVI